MSKRIVCVGLFVLVLVSFYSSYSTTNSNGKSSFSYIERRDDDQKFSSIKRVNGTSEWTYNAANLPEEIPPTAVRPASSAWEDEGRQAHSSAPLSPKTATAATDGTALTGDPNQTISILVQLSGEMGNNLDKISHGICLQEWLREEFNTPSTIVLRHQTRPKWVKGHRNLILCFPWTQQFEFSAGNTPSIDNLLRSPPNWWGDMMRVNSANVTEIRLGLKFVVDALRQGSINPSTTTAMISDGTNLTTPFLYANSFVHWHHCMDRYYEVIRRFLQFDSDKCCSQKPDANESVFHFRHFLKEMPIRGKRLGFEELNANDTARLLFSNLHAGDRVAITTRFADAAQPYVDALQQRNISARIIRGQSDVQDFCFLRSTQRELVGCSKSTFVAWAGLLSAAPVPVRAYSIDSVSTRRARGEEWFTYFNFTHPVLREQFSFEVYQQ